MNGSEGCVLVVEDDENSSRLMCELLRLRGFMPHPVSTGAAALDAAVTLEPRVILMDIQLPDLDGSAVLQRLRASSATASIPVVAVTALAMEGDRERLLADGFDGYLSKPIDVATLVDSVIPLMLGDR